jgi:hypothetical protein
MAKINKSEAQKASEAFVRNVQSMGIVVPEAMLVVAYIKKNLNVSKALTGILARARLEFQIYPLRLELHNRGDKDGAGVSTEIIPFLTLNVKQEFYDEKLDKKIDLFNLVTCPFDIEDDFYFEVRIDV